MQHLDLIGPKLEVFLKLDAQPFERGNALGEDDRALAALRRDADVFEVGDESTVLGGAVAFGFLGQLAKPLKGVPFDALGLREIRSKPADALVRCLAQGGG